MLMQIIPGAQGQARSNLLSATACSPPRVVLYQVAKHACKGALLTASHSKCMGIPFLEGVAVTARRKGACHLARNKDTWDFIVPDGVSGTIYAVQFTVYLIANTSGLCQLLRILETKQHGEDQR